MTDDDKKGETLLTEAEAARKLSIDPSTLNRWRSKGQAPPHYEYPSGMVRYPHDAVEEWMSEHMRTPNT